VTAEAVHVATLAMGEVNYLIRWWGPSR
jgi:hypothetical protein